MIRWGLILAMLSLAGCAAAAVDPCQAAADHLAACGLQPPTAANPSCGLEEANRVLGQDCEELSAGHKGWRETFGFDVHRMVTCPGDGAPTLRFITSAMDDAQAAPVGASLCEANKMLGEALSRIRRARNGDARERDLLTLWFTADRGSFDEIDLDRVEAVVRATHAETQERKVAFSALSVNWWDAFSLTADHCNENQIGVHAGGDRIGLCPAAWTADAGHRTRLILHELLHGAGGTEDHGYKGPCAYSMQNNLSQIVRLTPAQLLNNADTYTNWIANRPHSLLDPVGPGGQPGAGTCRSRS